MHPCAYSKLPPAIVRPVGLVGLVGPVGLFLRSRLQLFNCTIILKLYFYLIEVRAVEVFGKRITWRQKKQKMQILGFHHPPLAPGLDAENDWRRFERWATREPGRLSVREAVDTIKEMQLDTSFCLDNDTLERAIQLLCAAGIKVNYNPHISECHNFVRLRGILTLMPAVELTQLQELSIPECAHNCVQCHEWIMCSASDYHGECEGLEFLSDVHRQEC